MEQSLGVPIMKVLLSSACIALLVSMCDNIHGVLPTREAHMSLGGHGILGLHYIGMSEWLTAHVVEVGHRVDWHNTTQSCHLKHMVGLVGMASLQPKTVRCVHWVWHRWPPRSWGQGPDLSLGKTPFYTADFPFKIKGSLCVSWRIKRNVSKFRGSRKLFFLKEQIRNKWNTFFSDSQKNC